MLWSEASLSPSVSLARLSAVTFLSLQVILLPGGDVLQAGRDHHQRAGLVGEGSTLGAESAGLWACL